jgi:hypothetical protein
MGDDNKIARKIKSQIARFSHWIWNDFTKKERIPFMM